MRPLSPRVAVAVVLSAALLITTPALPASAATRPDQVGLVSFVGASLTSSGATLTVDWANVPGATKYQVFASTDYDALPKKTTPSATVTGSKATIKGLSKGKDYFVQVRALSSAGTGARSWRVGHRTMAAEAKLTSSSPRIRTLTWNICSNQCSSFSSRTKVINSRMAELKADLVGFQEASNYTKAPSGYAFGYNGQNDILYRTAAFSKVKAKSGGPTSGYARPGKKYASPGKGFAWAALAHRNGQQLLVVDVHLLVGNSGAGLKQREYEAGRVQPFIERTLARLAKSHSSKWKNAPVIVLGDINSQKGRTGDDTLSILKKAGWHDAFDQARFLLRQHHATANSDFETTPSIGITWGAQIDKVLVRPSRTIVYKWAHAAEMSGSRYASPLGSDHHPVLVELAVK